MIFSNRLADGGNITAEADMNMINIIETTVQRMSDLVRGLLDYSMVSHHQHDQGLFKLTHLNDIVDEILIDFELLIEEKQAKIEIGKLP